MFHDAPAYLSPKDETLRVATWERVPAGIAKRLDGPIKWPLFLWGNGGTGKTCLAFLIWRNKGGYWLDASSAIRGITEAWGKGTGPFLGIAPWPWRDGTYMLERFEAAPFVALDDLGVRKPTDPQYEALYEMCKRRDGRPMVVTCNAGPNELVKIYDDRILSRLTRGTVIEFSGKDRRIGG